MASPEFPQPPEPPAKKGLFGQKPAPGPGPEVSGLTEQINNLSARIRISEERFSDLRKRLDFIEQNLLSNHKKAMGDIKLLGEDVHQLKHSLTDVQDRIITVIKELRLTARKDDINVLKRYIELWDPVKFVTADQAEKIAREISGKTPDVLERERENI